MTKFSPLLIVLAICLLPAPLWGKASEKLLVQQAKKVAKLFSAKPQGIEKIMAPGFIKKVPVTRMLPLLKGVHKTMGTITSVKFLKRLTLVAARLTFSSATHKMTVTMAIDPKAPHLVTGLFIGPPTPMGDSLAKVIADCKKLPGYASVAITALTPRGPRILHAVKPRKRLAIGSAFKLYILGTLIRDIKRGQASWDQVVSLDKRFYSWPSGSLHTWPKGAPLTLYTLSTVMIARSDNTATDHLLFTLGRQRVERHMVRMGNLRRKGNRPFLSTAEMFKMKFNRSDEHWSLYLKLDERGKRMYLDNVVANLPRKVVNFGDMSRPKQIETLEWFASAEELCRAMDWLRRNTQGPKGTLGRGVLSTNPGVRAKPGLWKYTGFKGGSEPGVINLTFLLQRHDGRWFAMSFGWNNPSAKVSSRRLVALVQRSMNILGSQGKKPAKK